MDLDRAKRLAENAKQITALREMRSMFNAMGRTVTAQEYEKPIRLLMNEQERILDENR